MCSGGDGSGGDTSQLWSATRNAQTIYVLAVSHQGYATQYPVSEPLLSRFRTASIFVTETADLYSHKDVLVENAKRRLIPAEHGSLRDLLRSDRCQGIAEQSHFDENVRLLFSESFLNSLLNLSPKAMIYFVDIQGANLTAAQAKHLGMTTPIEYFLHKLSSASQTKRAFLDPEYWSSLDELTSEDVCDLVVGLVIEHSSVAYQLGFNASRIEKMRDLLTAGNLEGILDDNFIQYAPQNNALDKVARKWLAIRNRKMLQRILAISAGTDARLFVAVGAAHLGGESGLLELLRHANFSVSAVDLAN